MGINYEGDLTIQALSENKVSPAIILDYPHTQPVPSYLNNYTMWCFPDDFICYTEDLKPIRDIQVAAATDIREKDALYHFVMTDEKATRRYCTALLYYEKLYVKNVMKHASQISRNFPKVSLAKIFRNPLILDEDTQLVYCPKSLSLISSEPNFDVQRQILQYIYRDLILRKYELQPSAVVPVLTKHFSKFDQYILQFGIYKAEEAWDEQSENCKADEKEKRIQVKESHLGEFYVSLLFSHMCDKEGEHVITRLTTLKRFVERNSDHELLRFRHHGDPFLSIPNFSYRPLFKRLSLANITKLVIAMIQEHQLIFFSSSPGEIPLVTEALLSLIVPLQWNCIYIPFAPIELWEYTTAIQPYMIGFSKAYKAYILENLDSSNKVVVDLDDDSIIEPPQQYYPNEKCLLFLKSELFHISQHLNLSWKEKSLSWIEAILKTRQVFFEFVIMMIRNVCVFLREQRVQQQQFISSIKSIFDIDSYLGSFAESDRPFMVYVCQNTMLFTDFVERVDYQLQKGDHQDHFVHHYVKLMGESEHSVKRYCAPIIDYHIASYQHPHIVDPYPYLVKWIKYLDLGQMARIGVSSGPDQRVTENAASLSHNVLYFFSNEQRKLTRMDLNKRHSLFAVLPNRLVDLNCIFTEQVVNSVILRKSDHQHELYEVIKRQSQGGRKRSSEAVQRHYSQLMPQRYHLDRALEKPLLKDKRYSITNSFITRSLLDE